MLHFLLLCGEERPSSTSEDEKNTDETTALREMAIVGYDARVRFVFKCLAVSVLSHWEIKAHGESFLTPERAAAQATRKFEALEDGIAARLSDMSERMKREKKDGGRLGGRKQESTLGQNAIRGLKIGAAGEFFLRGEERGVRTSSCRVAVGRTSSAMAAIKVRAVGSRVRKTSGLGLEFQESDGGCAS